MRTLEELCERLTHFDEVSLLELLQVNSEDLVNVFKDRIDALYEDLCAELEEFDDESDA